MWTLLNQALNRLFDLWFLPLNGLPETLQIAITALPVTLFALLVFRYGSNQAQIVHAKNKISAYLLEFLLFNASLSVTLRSQLNVIRYALIYLRHTLRPLAIMLIPMVLVIVQIESRFAFQSLAPGQSIMLSVLVEGDTPVAEMDAKLILPTGLIRTTPALRIEQERKIIWRIQAQQAGSYHLVIKLDGVAVKKRLLVGVNPAHPSPSRYRETNINALLYPAEMAMKENGQISAIALDYPRMGQSLASLSSASWLLFVFSLVFGFLLRRHLGVSF